MSSCDYFTTYAVDVDSKAVLEADEKSFLSLLILDGECEITADDTVKAKKGDSIFVPAGTGKVIVDGKCKAILTRV